MLKMYSISQIFSVKDREWGRKIFEEIKAQQFLIWGGGWGINTQNEDYQWTLKQNTHTIPQSNYWKLENLSTRKRHLLSTKSQGTLKDKKI